MVEAAARRPLIHEPLPSVPDGSGCSSADLPKAVHGERQSDLQARCRENRHAYDRSSNIRHGFPNIDPLLDAGHLQQDNFDRGDAGDDQERRYEGARHVLPSSAVVIEKSAGSEKDDAQTRPGNDRAKSDEPLISEAEGERGQYADGDAAQRATENAAADFIE